MTQYCIRFLKFPKYTSSICCWVTLYILPSLSGSTELRNRNYGTYVPCFRFRSSLDPESEGSIYKVTQYCRWFCTFENKRVHHAVRSPYIYYLHSLGLQNFRTGITKHMFCGSGSVVPWNWKLKVVYLGRHNTVEGFVNSKNTRALYAVGSPYIYYPHSPGPRNYGTGTTEHMFHGSGSVVPWTRKVKKVYIGRHNTAEGIVNSKNTKSLYAFGSPFIYYLHTLGPRNYRTGTTEHMFRSFDSVVPVP